VCALHEELWAGTYRHGAYNYFTIYEPKERLVAAAPFRDRVVHHAIVRVVEPIFERRFIEDSYACRTGKGVPRVLGHIPRIGGHPGMEFNFLRGFRFYTQWQVRRGGRASEGG